MAGLERSAGEHDPVLADGCPRRSPGLAGLREATVRKAVEEASAIDFREVIEPRPVIRALAGRVVGAPGGGGLDHAGAGTVRIALKRLFVPLSSTSWPQRTHLLARRGRDHAQGCAGGFVHAVGQGASGRPDSGIGAGDLFVLRRRFRRRAAALGRRGRVPGANRVGQSTVPVHGDRRRRSLVDPRRAGEGGGPSHAQVAGRFG